MIQEKEIKMVDFLVILWDNKKIVFFAMLIVAVLSVAISFMLPKWYKSTAVIMNPDGASGALGMLPSNLSMFGFGGLGGKKKSKRIMTIIESKTLLEKIEEKYNIQEELGVEFKKDALQEINANFNHFEGKHFQIHLSYLDKNQERVQGMLEFILKAIDEINIELATSSGKNNVTFVGSRLQMISDSLMTAENELADFQIKHGLVNIDKQVSAAIDNIAALKAKIVAKKMEIELLKAYTNDDNAKVLSLKTELEIMEKTYSKYVNGSIDRFSIDFSDVPKLQVTFIELKRKILYFSKLLEYLGPQYEEAKITSTKKIPTIQIIDHPSYPEKRDKPHRALIVIAMCMSAFFFIWFALIVKEFCKINKHKFK